MVRETPTISCPLHPYVRFLDQPGGAMVRRTHQQANSTWRVPKRKRPGSGHPRVHRRAQRRSQALRLDQNGRPNPGQHRSLRAAHDRCPTLLTYVTNHWDGRLDVNDSLRYGIASRLLSAGPTEEPFEVRRAKAVRPFVELMHEQSFSEAERRAVATSALIRGTQMTDECERSGRPAVLSRYGRR